MKLQGKVALVTGAGKGIGRGIALRLAHEGAAIVVNDVDRPAAEAVTAEIVAAGGQAMAAIADVTASAQVREMVATADARLGPIDILVNNAGWDRFAHFIDTTEEFWDKVLAINLKGPIICSHAVLGGMIARRQGKIINISSEAARLGSPNETVYSAAKGGVVGFTKALAREVARFHINVNSVAPGLIDTPLNDAVREQAPGSLEGIAKLILWGRMGQPQDIANAVAFLASEEADYITGQLLGVSGGLAIC